MTKQITVENFLSTAQLRKAIAIYKSKPRNLHRELLNKVVLPHMAEINRKLDQENHPDYIAYAIEYALNQAAK
jgi:hypothetical protein